MHSVPFQPLGTLLDAHGNLLVEFEHASAQHILCVRWYGNLTGQEVVQVAREYLKVAEQLEYPLLLNDKSHATGDWSEAMEWLEYEWLPHAIEQGLRAIAYVFSPDMHNQLASIEFFERVRQYIPIQLFHDMSAALQWLRSQQRLQLPKSGQANRP